MKKILSTAILLAAVSQALMAIPAKPGKHTALQPDGTTIVLQSHGDEHLHWTTDASGNVVELGQDGFWHVSSMDVVRKRAKARPRKAWSSYNNPGATNFGDRKILCLLVQFSDVKFKISDPKTRFTNMLGKEGYSENGAHGSVRDYYVENSLGQYRPSFDVFGPVTLKNPITSYDEDDNNTPKAILEALDSLGSKVNLSDYDTDGNGAVDMILMYYAGYSQAEGGTNTIWPHQYPGYFGTRQGLSLNRYFCTAELSGNSGSTMCGIGATCHEFAHSLGLPDFYDTDYETNGQAGTTGMYDLMCSGCYNGNSQYPAYMSATERNMLGWMPVEDYLVSGGDYSLEPVQGNKTIRMDSDNSGEYFMLETRVKEGWDTYIPEEGLLVYHVDQSSNAVTNSYTAGDLWKDTNNINVYSSHPCYYLLTTDGSLPSSSQTTGMCFTGAAGASSVTPETWGGTSSMMLSNITLAGGKVSFRAIPTSTRTLSGVVKDNDGNPVQGAQVTLSRSAYPFNAAPSTLPDDLITTTDASGAYVFELAEDASSEQIVRASKDGYIPAAENVALQSRTQVEDLTLFPIGGVVEAEISRHDDNASYVKAGLGTGSIAVAMRYTAEEIAEKGMAGSSIDAIYFASSSATYSKAYVVVFFGTERVLAADITDYVKSDDYTGIDVSSAGLKIPEGKDVYIGYGFTGLTNSSDRPFYVAGPSDQGGANFAMPDFLSSSSWQEVSFGGVIYNFVIYADISTPIPDSIANYGVASIEIADGVPTAVAPHGKTLRSVAWTLDDAPVDAPPAVSSLAKGSHTYCAILTYYDGTTDKIWHDIDVN